MLRKRVLRLTALLVALVVAAPVMAQNWPDHPLKFIVSAPRRQFAGRACPHHR